MAQEFGAASSASQSPTAFNAAVAIPERQRENRGYTESPPQTHGLQTVIPTAPGSQYQPRDLGLSPNIPRNLTQSSILRNRSSSSTNTPNTEFEPERSDSNLEVGGTPSIQNEQENFHDIFSELMTGSEHEIAFLTRHFSEFLGPWYVTTHAFPLNFHANMVSLLGWTYLILANFSLYTPLFEQLIMII